MSIKQAIEALESCAPGDYSTGHVIHPSYDEEKVNAALAALRSMPQGEPVPAKNNDVDRLLRQVFLLCEAVEDLPEIDPKNEHERGFDRGRRFQAKQIRRAIGDWFQWTFCGSSFMGEPVLAAAPTTEATSSPSDAERLDAARYRWLRRADAPFDVWTDDSDGFIAHSETLDAAIDAAILATKGGEI